MDSVLKQTKCTQSYLKRIQSSEYEQSATLPENDTSSIVTKLTENTQCTTLTELIISTLDANYSLTNDKPLYLKHRLLEIIEDFDSKKSNYGKKMKPLTVQLGFENSNDTLSSIAVLQDYFNINIRVFSNDVCYSLFNRHEKMIHVHWNGHYWYAGDALKYNKDSLMDQLSCIECDVSPYDIYPKLLKPISSYKVNDLHTLCVTFGISIMQLGKKKTKQTIYQELCIYILEHNLKSI
jgi:CRISPR/Cas system-associated endoribonuclease Cas2